MDKWCHWLTGIGFLDTALRAFSGNSLTMCMPILPPSSQMSYPRCFWDSSILLRIAPVRFFGVLIQTDHENGWLYSSLPICVDSRNPFFSILNPFLDFPKSVCFAPPWRTKSLPALDISVVLFPSKESKFNPAVNPEGSGVDW